MIITLKGANFSASNIGTLDSWFISWSGSGLTAAAGNATSIKKDGTSTTTLTYTYNTENYEYVSGTVKDATGATVGSVTNTSGTVTVTINAGNTIKGKITIAIVMEYVEVDEEPETPGSGSSPNYGWAPADVVWELGSTDDDAAGTMGNLTTNNARLRTNKAIKGQAVRVNVPESLDPKIWYNIFDDDGKLTGTSGTSLYVTKGSMTIVPSEKGGTQVWPILKIGDAGTEPITSAFSSQVSADVFESNGLPIAWESGTFSDDTGAKTDNAGRLRTPSKVEVPSGATGLIFVPTGTFDLWVKTYDSVSQSKPTMNGVNNHDYWNTNNQGVVSLTWSKLGCTQKPAYMDFVLKTNSSIITPDDAKYVFLDFAY